MATASVNAGGTVTGFVRRFMGALMLDRGTFENVEADRTAGGQAVLVVLLACVAGGLAAIGSTSMTLASFAIGAAITLSSWVVWALLINTIGTQLLAEPQTRSRPSELLRTMGFATAPGVLFAFGAMAVAAPFAIVVGSLWMIATTVLAVRQALDYRSLGRATLVCVVAGLLTFGIVALAGILLGRPVS